MLGFLTLLLVILAWVASADERRVDLFAPDGTRQGYAVVDEKAGRVDFFDVNSRRIGWGRMDISGKVERFGLDGRREGETIFPFRGGQERQAR